MERERERERQREETERGRTFRHLFLFICLAWSPTRRFAIQRFKKSWPAPWNYRSESKHTRPLPKSTGWEKGMQVTYKLLGAKHGGSMVRTHFHPNQPDRNLHIPPIALEVRTFKDDSSRTCVLKTSCLGVAGSVAQPGTSVSRGKFNGNLPQNHIDRQVSEKGNGRVEAMFRSGFLPRCMKFYSLSLLQEEEGSYHGVGCERSAPHRVFDVLFVHNDCRLCRIWHGLQMCFELSSSRKHPAWEIHMEPPKMILQDGLILIPWDWRGTPDSGSGRRFQYCIFRASHISPVDHSLFVSVFLVNKKKGLWRSSRDKIHPHLPATLEDFRVQPCLTVAGRKVVLAEGQLKHFQYVVKNVLVKQFSSKLRYDGAI